MKEVTEQKWLYDGEVVDFKKYNDTQYLLVSQVNKVLRVIDRIVSFNVGDEEIEVYFSDDSEYIDYFVIEYLIPVIENAKID